MSPRLALVALALAVLALSMLTGCADEAPPAEPGPSPQARAVLRAIEGRGFLDQVNAFGGGRWIVGPWEEGQVRLTRGGDTTQIPVQTDGDVEDLYVGVTWTAAPVRGEKSEAYRKAWVRAAEAPTAAR